jgi:hypothetical protein
MNSPPPPPLAVNSVLNHRGEGGDELGCYSVLSTMTYDAPTSLDPAARRNCLKADRGAITITLPISRGGTP